ncbi:MAG: sigma-70 family RNA polymerase sigma factor [Gemmataceae bacterium]|nr:sigma-70 family RNA polymerase sigma factor [Gemmataceae bacterium]MCI0741774.1 sigma-70 family RNA polymerase sigma factor [Gemmataceae bacterium]
MEFADRDLMERWQQGDADAFEFLVRRWQRPVARFLARYVGRDDLVADLCQEVFLRVFRGGASYKPRSAFSSWIFQVALNVARDAARRQKPGFSLPCPEVSDSSAPDAALAERELAEEVGQAVAALPEPLRLVLVLRHYQGMSFEEMSRLLRTPPSTLKSRFAAALSRLRKRLHSLQPDL